MDLTRTYIRALRDISEEIRVKRIELSDLESERDELIKLVDSNEEFKSRYPDKYLQDYQLIKDLVNKEEK